MKAAVALNMAATVALKRLTVRCHLFLACITSARVDGLVKRVLTPSEMEEHYVDRPDFMYYRHVTYEKLSKKQLQQEGKGKLRQIVTVVDRFRPNPAIPPNNDMAQRTLLFAENQIKVVYQLEEGRNTASSREFVVPPMNPDQAVLLTFEPDATTSYQVTGDSE